MKVKKLTKLKFDNKILFFCPYNTSPSGGSKQIYRMVDVLNGIGIQAYVVHQYKGQKLNWFKNDTKILYDTNTFDELNKFPDHYPYLNFKGRIAHFLIATFKNKAVVEINKKDIIVFPEFYGTNINKVCSKNNRVIYVQGCYLTFKNHPIGKRVGKTPYLQVNTLATLVNSDDGLSYHKNLFPNNNIFKIRHAIDSTLFKPTRKEKILAYMSRKNPEDSRQVINALALRGLLDNWSIIDLNLLSHEKVAEILNKSAVFLSTNGDEGFPLPSIEAMSSGCLVIGYTGKGGREYFKEEFSAPIPEKEIQLFIKSANKHINHLNNDFSILGKIGAKARKFVLANYNERNELMDISKTWENIIKLHQKSIGNDS